MLSSFEKFNKIPISYLAPFGRGGSIFVQGLFDGHPQIAQIPILFPFLDIYSKNPKRTLSNLQDKIKKEICETYNIDIDFNNLKIGFLDYLSKINNGSSEERQFRAIHYAWVTERNQQIEDIICILWHPHRLDRKYIQFLLSFKKKSFILCCRSPFDSLVSTYQHWTNNKILPMLPVKNTAYVRHPWIIGYLLSSVDTYNFFKKLKNISCFIKIENLNQNPRLELKKLCKILKINYLEKVLSSSTCLGRSMIQIAGKQVKGFSKTKSYSRNRSDDLAQILCGYLFNQASREFGYNVQSLSLMSKSEVLYQMIFSNIWWSSLKLCYYEAKKASELDKIVMLKIIRLIKYYMQFIKRFSLIILLIIISPR